MKHQYKLYAWEISHFAAKLRGYMNYKQLDYQEKAANAYDMKVRLPKKIGASAMPALETREGEWLSDTPEIIAELEQRHPENSITPPTPRQAIAASLFENWVDDTWLKISMHTRWSYSENWDKLLKQESGKNLLPFAPRFIREPIATKLFAGRIRGYMPNQGIKPEQTDLLERWALGLLDILEQHFSQHDYLLGGKPCIGDYALVGSFYPHLNRDPWPKREWLDPRPNIQRWVQRTHSGEQPAGDYIAGDKIPESIQPLFAIIAREYVPLLASTASSLRKYIKDKAIVPGTPLPRGMEGLTYPMANGEYTSNTLTYSLWRMQRTQKVYQSMTDADKKSVDLWLAETGLPDLMATDFGPALERDGLSTRLAKSVC